MFRSIDVDQYGAILLNSDSLDSRDCGQQLTEDSRQPAKTFLLGCRNLHAGLGWTRAGPGVTSVRRGCLLVGHSLTP